MGWLHKAFYFAECFLWVEPREKLFCLTNSLCDKASEYPVGYLPNEALQSFDVLVAALEVRFKDRSPVTASLAQLEARKLQPREKVLEFFADIRQLVLKSYPTADDWTRETIGVPLSQRSTRPKHSCCSGNKRPPNSRRGLYCLGNLQ